MFLDRIVLGYTAWVALLVVLRRADVSNWPSILAFHLFVLAVMIALPKRGASWETAPPGEPRWRRRVRGGLRFFRYSYLLLLMVFYFEEVEHTVNALSPAAPFWFESRLYAADRFFFGDLPSILLNPFTGTLRNELMHGFYFSYYFIVIGGVVFAWLGRGSSRPGPAFHRTLTSVVTAFLLCFVWYPFLPARGPWENRELMAALTPFDGRLFVPVVEALLARGAVSGGCFPSSHVAASWAVVLGLARFHPRAALVCGFFTAGLTFACVYTRYHHAVDVPAGILAAIAGAAIGYSLRRSDVSPDDMP
jgi:membrane-associated phospholipid phosphatase